MYCASCGREIPDPSWRCSTCGRGTTAFWLHVYSAAALVVASAVAVFYFWKLVPMATQAHLMTGAEIPIVMGWQIAVSNFLQDWLLILVVVALLLGFRLLRWARALPNFFRSGHVTAIFTFLVMAALLATLLLGFWSMGYLFVDTTEVISG